MFRARYFTLICCVLLVMCVYRIKINITLHYIFLEIVCIWARAGWPWRGEIQDAKITQKIAICAPSHKFVGLYLRNWSMYRQSEKKLLNNSISSTCLHNVVNLGLLTAEIGRWVLSTPANFIGFRVLASLYTAPTSLNGGQPNFAHEDVEFPQIFSAH